MMLLLLLLPLLPADALPSDTINKQLEQAPPSVTAAARAPLRCSPPNGKTSADYKYEPENS